jgi:NADH dehydrogenase FAD-containing subunit
MHRIVVLGAGYAGLPTVNRIAKQTHRDEVELVLVSTHDEFVERPRLHQLAAGQDRPHLPLSDFLATGIQLRLGRVDRIDPDTRSLAFTSEVSPLEYDTLVYAPGSTIDLLAVPGATEHAIALTDPESARAIASRLTSDLRSRVVVCGGGLTGLELAAEVAESYPLSEVTLVTRGTAGGWLSPKAQAYVTRALDDLGISRVEDASGTEVRSRGLVTDLGTRVEFDLCLWAGGFSVPRLGADAGLRVDEHDRVVVDPTLRSVSNERIYAVGDAAAVPGPWGDSLAMGCRTGGFTGPTAADAIVARLSGRPAPEFRFRYFHECLSLGRRRHVIQFLDRDGNTLNRVLRGRLATGYKNTVLNAGRLVGRHAGPYGLRRRRHVIAQVVPLQDRSAA